MWRKVADSDGREWDVCNDYSDCGCANSRDGHCMYCIAPKELHDIGVPVSRTGALRIARETLENAERERVADAKLDATRGVKYDDGRSVIIGTGYGSSHVWEKPDLFQMKLHVDGKTILLVGGPTVYRCKKCLVIFRHYYHETPDIFEAIKKAFVPDECAGVG